MNAPSLRLHRAKTPRAAIVMAHGVMSHAGWLEPLAEALAARGITAAAVDRPGSGASRDREGASDPARWIEDLVHVVDDLRRDHDRVALLGWCWGARTAILAAQATPVVHLVLAAPGLAMLATIRARAAELAATPDDPVPLPFDIDWFSDDTSVVDRIRRDPLAWTAQPRAFMSASRAALDRALAVLPSLTMPRTLVLAERDRIVDNAAVTALTPGATVVRLAGGHALVLESPDAVAAPIAAAVAP